MRGPSLEELVVWGSRGAGGGTDGVQSSLSPKHCRDGNPRWDIFGLPCQPLPHSIVQLAKGKRVKDGLCYDSRYVVV